MPLLPVVAFQAAVAWWPYPAGLDRLPPPSTVVLDRAGRPLAAYANADGQWCEPLSAGQMGPHLRAAIVAVEDERFEHHGGVDWRGVAAAAWDDLTTLSARRGASTIAMQLHRMRQPAPRRSVVGKVAQAVRACQISRTMTKADVLTEYLNRAPFGGNLTGVGAASWRYYGKPCNALSLGQAALLAGLPQSPNRFRPDRHPAAATARRDHVLARMVACGAITSAQQRQAAAEPVDATWHALPQDATDDGLRPTLDRLAVAGGGTVRTTVDADAQRRASAIVDAALRSADASGVTAAAAVVLDTRTAAVLAAVSRSPPRAGSVDLTVCARSSGSTLKPFIYAAAFDAGVCGPATVLDDAPAAWAGYAPDNYDGRFDGPEAASLALARSRNVPALAVLSRVGVGRAVSVMSAAGLATLSRTPDRYGLSLAVGGAEVTPLELAGAYATLAGGGAVRRPWVTGDGAGEPSRRLLRPSSCLQVLQCLADPDRTRDVCPSAADLRPAWKTGTSSGHRDAWCAAVTPRRTVVVWLGNADGGGSDALVGHDLAAPVALRLLAAVDAGGPGFPSIVDNTAAAVPPPVRPLSITSPVDGQQVVRDPAVSGDGQRVPLRATSADVWWFVDGGAVRPSADGAAWWTPVPGRHDVRVLDAAGHSADAWVDVR